MTIICCCCSCSCSCCCCSCCSCCSCCCCSCCSCCSCCCCCCCCCCCNVVSIHLRHIQNTLTPGNLIPKGFLSVEQIVSKGGVENCDNRIPYLSCSMLQCSATSFNMIQYAAKWRTTHGKTTYRAYQRINPSVHVYKALKNHSRNMSFELTPSF